MMSELGGTGSLDPLRVRQRPGVEVDARAATWESTVFAIAAGQSVRYLEVPANEVRAFLDAVDNGELDDELVGLASTPTGAVLDAPGRIRKLAAFDRLVRHAVARSERDPVTGRIAEPDWRPRKRERDDEASRHVDRSNEHAARSTGDATATEPTVAAAMVSTTTVAAAAISTAAISAGTIITAKRAWWSSPAVVAGAVAAVVVIAAGTVLLIRSGDDPESAASTGAAVTASASAGVLSSISGSTEAPAVSPATGPAGAAAASAPTSTASATESSRPADSPPADSPPAEAPPAESLVVPAGPVNPLAGSYAMTRTIIDNSGNNEVAIGTVDTGTVTFTAECAEPGCAISGDWGPATISGSQVSFSGTVAEPCKNDPNDNSISVIDSWSVSLQIGGQESGAVTSLSGTGVVTVSELNGCDAEIRPLTQSYELTRTG